MKPTWTKGLFKRSNSKVSSEGPRSPRRPIRVTIGPKLAKTLAQRQIPQLREKVYKPAIVIPAKKVQESEIKITSIDGRFSLLRPKSSNPDTCQVILTENPKDLLDYLKQIVLVDADDLVTFDTETTGTRIFGNKDFRIVSLGVSHGYSALSLDTRDMSWDELTALLRKVRDLCSDIKLPLAAHNLFYDSSAIAKYLGSVRGDKSGAPGWMNYRYCTYALFRYLSSEGFQGQSHSLKFAMTELLLWQDTNEKEQHDWLISNGYVKGPRGVHNPKNKTPEAQRLEVLRAKLAEGKQYKPDKGMMYKVPHEILGKYNALDCFATYRLYRDVLLPCMNKYTTSFFKWWHSGPMLMSIRNAVDNYQNGIFVDKKILEDFKEPFRQLIKDTIFYDFKKQYPEHYMAVAIEKFEKWEKAKYPKRDYKIIDKTPPEKPKTYRRKDGRLSAAGLRYEMKLRALRALPDKTPTKDLVIYKARRKQLIRWIREGKIATHFHDKHWAYKILFNPGSTDDKQKFLYHNVEYEIIPSKYKDKPGRLRLENGIEVDMSDSGGLPTGKSAIIAIGGKKHPLNKYNRELKRLQFVDNCYTKVVDSTDELLHIGFKTPGTNTQRLAGDGGLNLQNLVKDYAFLRAWRPKNRENHLLCQVDLCYHPDTDVLTRSGWKRIGDVTTADEVWEVDSITLKGNWIHPLYTIEHEFEGDMHVIGNLRGKLCVTPNHKMLYIGGHCTDRPDKTARNVVCRASDGIPFHGACIPITTTTDHTVESNWDVADIWRAAALQADGCVDIRAKKRRNFYLQVSRPEKRTKANELFGPGHMQKLRPEHKLQKELWSSIKFDHVLLETDGTRRKLLRADLIGDNQLDIFLEALAFWDGHRISSKRFIYSSISKEQVDLIQHRLVRAGYECKCDFRVVKGSKYLGCYNLSIGRRDRVMITPSSIAVIPYTGRVYCLTVPKGFFLVRYQGQTFVSGNCAVEPHVFTELSKDESMWQLYGPAAKPNDVYLFTGAKIGGVLGNPFLAEGYDPLNPTKESISSCKKKHKELRNVSKTLLLSDDYGASARKQWQTLKIQGYNFTLSEVEEMHNKLADVYKGKRSFGEKLKKEWEKNKGWILDGFGMPICVDKNKIKDLPNRICQKTGHMVLQLWQYFVTHEFWKQNIDYSWMVMDWHDEMIPEIHREQVSKVKQIYRDTLQLVNDKYLGGMIKIKAEPQVATCLAEIKVENYVEEELKHLLIGVE